jgi:cystathionine gamma-synthase
MRPGKTRLVWIETPANPTWLVTDIAAAATIAHQAGAKLAVDNTAASPVLTRPIEHGADIVMHSATKYLNGHSDVLAGALVTSRDDEFWKRVKAVRTMGGAVLGPFEAWLLLRGMRTLYLRVRQQSQSALTIARHFKDHPKLLRVCYPGLPDDPGHAVAKRQMQGGYGGMLSLRFKGGAAAALAFVARLELFVRATSLGGVESLIEHRGTVEGPDSPTPQDLLRVSVGIEHVDDLIADLEQGFAAI